MKKFIIYIGLSIILQISFGQLANGQSLCKIISLEANKEGTIFWTAMNEGDTKLFLIEQFRWGKWIKIGQVNTNFGESNKEHHYSIQIITHSGKNRIRVVQGNIQGVYKDIEFNSNIPKVKFTLDKEKKEILFTSETLFEIINTSGTVVKRGLSNLISCDDLPKGNYTLNYDNSTTKLSFSH